MMSERHAAVPGWFPYLDLACVSVAGGLWYAFPCVGPWPLVLALAPWAVRFALVGRFTRRTPFDPPAALFLLSAVVAIWAAYDRPAALAKFWQIVGALLLFYALVNAGSQARVREWFLTVFGSALALYFLVTNWDTYTAKIAILTRLGQNLQALLPSIPGPRWNPNVIAGVLVTLLPFAGLAVVHSLRKLRSAPRPRGLGPWLETAVALGALVLMSVAFVLTTSRAAWLAFAGVLLFTGLWLISERLSRSRAVRRMWLLPVLLALVLIVVAAIGIAWPGGPVALLELLPGPNPAFSRVALLQNTPMLLHDYLLTGAGLDSFMMLYSTYVLQLHVGFLTHSHNFYLNVVVEQGILGLLALIWMWVLFARAVWREGVQRGFSRESGGLGAATLSLTAILLHGLFDNALYGSGGLFVLFAPLAFAVPFLPERRQRVAPWRMWLFPAGAIVLLVLVLVRRDPLLSLLYSNLGAVRQSQAELGVYSWPEWPIQDAVRREIDLGQSITDFERALEYDPGNPTANRRLGMIELSLGEYEDALVHLEAAYAAEPGSVTNRQLLGEALLVNGRLEEGRALWAGLSNEQDQLNQRIFWYEHIGDVERAEWLRQAAEGP